MGNYTKVLLSVIFGFGVERGFLAANPAFKIKNIRRPKDAPQTNRPWSDAERETVLASLPAHMVVPIALMMFCSLDPQDALKLRRSAIDGDVIDTKRGKTGVAVWLPIPSPLREVLAAAPHHDAIAICANSYGLPWTTHGFSSSWKKVRKRLEQAKSVAPALTLKGLRHTVATILAESGCDERTITDMLGQKTIEMARASCI